MTSPALAGHYPSEAGRGFYPLQGAGGKNLPSPVPSLNFSMKNSVIFL